MAYSSQHKKTTGVVMPYEDRPDVAKEGHKNIVTQGPGKYEPYKSTQETKFGKFGKVERNFRKGSIDEVGPGKYKWDKAPAIKQPEFSIGKDTRKELSNAPKYTPAPGFYDVPQYGSKSGNKNSPKFSIGKEERKDDAKLKDHVTKTPGVGSYELRTDPTKDGPKYSVGKELRKDISDNKFQTPAPGAYEFKNTIGEALHGK